MFCKKFVKKLFSPKRFSTSYDLCIIGAGPGGYVAAIRAAQNGLNTVCVEGYGRLGGTCLNVGCIPSKALLNISQKYHDIKKSNEIGIYLNDLTYNWDEIQSKKDEVVRGLTGGIEFLFKKNKVDYKKGWATITSNKEVSVNLNDGSNEVIKAKNILIATGSEVTTFPGIEMDEEIFISSTGALSLKTVPEKLVVVGAGVIGLELGSVYARLGTKVEVIEFADTACPFVDKEITKTFVSSLKKQGITFNFKTKVISGKIVNGKAELVVENMKNGKERKVISDVCLISIGRKPYTSGLGCSDAGIELNDLGQIEINDYFQTSVRNVYAIGDVVTGPMLAHKAEEEGIACVDLLAGKDGHINYNSIPSVIYTHPEIAWVGKTEEQCKEEGIEYAVGKFPFVGNSRARASLEPEGMVKLISDKNTSRLIGAHIIGVNAGEIIHELVLGIEYGVSPQDIARTCHAHPTLSEAIKEAALACFFKPIHV